MQQCAYQPLLSERILYNPNMAEDKRLKLSLTSIVKSRRWSGKICDRICLVFKPTGESVNNIKELWGKVKNDKELYAKLLMDTALQGEKENDFDMRARNIGVLTCWEITFGLILRLVIQRGGRRISSDAGHTD